MVSTPIARREGPAGPAHGSGPGATRAVSASNSILACSRCSGVVDHRKQLRAATMSSRRTCASVAVKMGGFCVKFYRRDRNSKFLKCIRGINDSDSLAPITQGESYLPHSELRLGREPFLFLGARGPGPQTLWVGEYSPINQSRSAPKGAHDGHRPHMQSSTLARSSTLACAVGPGAPYSQRSYTTCRRLTQCVDIRDEGNVIMSHTVNCDTREL